jgi:hypothetical protein
MQQPEALWREFPLNPTPTPAPDQQAVQEAAPTASAVGAAATVTPTPTPTPSAKDAADGRIELPGGATITYPNANGTERAIGSPPPVATPAGQSDSGDLVALSGQAGLYVVVVAVLVVLMARWLLNHTWRAAVTVAVMLLGMAMLGLILIRWATDIGIVG